MRIQVQVDAKKFHPSCQVAEGAWYTAWIEKHAGKKIMKIAAPSGPVAAPRPRLRRGAFDARVRRRGRPSPAAAPGAEGAR